MIFFLLKLYNIGSLVYKGNKKLVKPPLNISDAQLEAYCIAARNNVVKSSLSYFLDIDVLNTVSVVSNKLLPVLEASVKLPINISYDIILPVLNSIDTISSTIIPESNTIHFNKMEYLANNYLHILNMQNIAIDLLSSKANTSLSSVIPDFNFHKFIPLLERYYISNVSCSWGHSWSINTLSINTVWLTVYQYSIYLIPLLVPLVPLLLNSISNIIFNIFEMFLYYLYPWLHYLNNIIINSILLIIQLIELLFFLYTHILNNGIRRSLADLIIWYVGRYIYYIDYLRICLYCDRFLSFDIYNQYVRYENYISNCIDDLTELIRVRTRLVRRLQRSVSHDIYIIDHANTRWNSRIHGRHILSLQVSNRYRLRTVNLNGQCRRIAALYLESANTQDQRVLLVQLLNLDRWLSSINHNFISEFLPLFDQLFVLEQTRSGLHVENISNDFNNFIVVYVYEDGHIEYLYSWAFHG